MHTWGGWGMGWGMAVMMVVWLVIPLGFAALWLRSVRRPWRSRDRARELLRERFARGEIDAGTFRNMSAQLGAGDAWLDEKQS